jgi:hypothetical protein
MPDEVDRMLEKPVFSRLFGSDIGVSKALS